MHKEKVVFPLLFPCTGRFKQVQTLALTADAFFCLYSYVSKTPVQKISPAHLFWAFPEIPESWNVPSKPEVVSPLQRLRNAISRMCLYTLPRERGTVAASNMQSPGRHLGQVVWEVMGKLQQDQRQFDVANVKDECHTRPTGGTLYQRRMGCVSSKSTTLDTSPTSSCCYWEAPSPSEKKREIAHAFVLPGLELLFSRCTRETCLDGLDHFGCQELYHYGQHVPDRACSPEEGSEESEGE